MESRIKFILWIIFISFSSYQIGAIMTIRDIPTMASAPANPVVVQANDLIIELNQAAAVLANCVSFKTKYPSQRRKLLNVGTIFFGYGPSTNKWFKNALALTPWRTKTIILTDAFFALTHKQRTAVMGHELMHIIGVPSSLLHNTPFVNVNIDVVYALTYTCFPEAP